MLGLGQPQNTGSTNCVSFCGNKLLPVQVFLKAPSGDGLGGIAKELVAEKCCFTQLNKDDIDLLKSIREAWSESLYGSWIINAFLKKMGDGKKYRHREFFMVESASETEPLKRVKALARVSKLFQNSVEVEYVQSVSAMKDLPYTKGAGTAMMYGIGKLSEKQHIDAICVSAVSSARNFYEKIGMSAAGASRYRLGKANYGLFFRNIESKLGINPAEFEIKGGSFF